MRATHIISCNKFQCCVYDDLMLENIFRFKACYVKYQDEDDDDDDADDEDDDDDDDEV